MISYLLLADDLPVDKQVEVTVNLTAYLYSMKADIVKSIVKDKRLECFLENFEIWTDTDKPIEVIRVSRAKLKELFDSHHGAKNGYKYIVAMDIDFIGLMFWPVLKHSITALEALIGSVKV